MSDYIGGLRDIAAVVATMDDEWVFVDLGPTNVGIGSWNDHGTWRVHVPGVHVSSPLYFFVRYTMAHRRQAELKVLLKRTVPVMERAECEIMAAMKWYRFNPCSPRGSRARLDGLFQFWRTWLALDALRSSR
jgi:hypothetical protein